MTLFQGWSIYSNIESTRIFTTQIQPIRPARGNFKDGHLLESARFYCEP